METATALDSTSIEMIGFERGEIRCALPLSWSRSVVDEFEVVGVPRAPEWLAGVTSIDGVVSPVIDLAAFARSEHIPGARMSARRNHRLLVGGVVDESGNQSLSFLFDGLPTQFRGTIEAQPSSKPPPALAAAILGACTPDNDLSHYWAIDSHQIYETLGTLLNR